MLEYPIENVDHSLNHQLRIQKKKKHVYINTQYYLVIVTIATFPLMSYHNFSSEPAVEFRQLFLVVQLAAHGCIQPQSSGWARAQLFSFFLIFPSIFSLIFSLFCSPVGQVAHLGKPWLCHWVDQWKEMPVFILIWIFFIHCLGQRILTFFMPVYQLHVTHKITQLKTEQCMVVHFDFFVHLMIGGT